MSEQNKLPAHPIQLELFRSTKQLNLSGVYESIPKEIAPKDAAIVWESENIALPIEKSFSVDGQTFVSEIKPATLKTGKGKTYKSHFPYFRELRIEYALISLASKQWLGVDYHDGTEPTYNLQVTFYKIQKEIVEAINEQEGRDLKPNDCPYNTTSLHEGLKILKESSYTVYDASGRKEYSFNRIKDFYRNGDKLIIELGSMICGYISRGDWNVADAYSILASKTYYTMKLKTLLNMKFRYARRGSFYNPSFSLLAEKIGFGEYANKRDAIRKMKQLLESLSEIEYVLIETKKEGRKVVDAVFQIAPSNQFVDSIIEANKLNRRAKDALISPDGESVLIEPLESDFRSRTDYEKAKREYDTKKGQMLYAQRHLTRNS